LTAARQLNNQWFATRSCQAFEQGSRRGARLNRLNLPSQYDKGINQQMRKISVRKTKVNEASAYVIA
jgi:hypothetical protein